MGGHLDVHEHVEIAARPRAPQVGHTLAAAADLRPGLGAGLDVQQLLPVRRHDGHLGTQGRLGHREPQLEVQLRAIPLEDGMLLDVRDDVEVAGRAAARGRLPLPREADLVPVIDAGRDGDPQRALALRAAVATTGRAGLLDDLARAPAAATGGHVDDLAQQRGAHLAHLAAAAALRTGGRRAARFGPAAGAGLAAVERAEAEVLVSPVDGLVEGQRQVVAQVSAGGPARSAGGAPPA